MGYPEDTLLMDYANVGTKKNHLMFNSVRLGVLSLRPKTPLLILGKQVRTLHIWV